MKLESNKFKLVGLLTILISLWIVLYFLPELFVSLFQTILGNVILILITFFISMYDITYSVVFGIILIILYRFSQLSGGKEKEQFTSKSIQDFLTIQHSINPNIIFDMNMIKSQATQNELDYFNKNGLWYWTENTQTLYKDAVAKNPYIRTNPEDALNYAMKIYNENSILQIINYKNKLKN